MITGTVTDEERERLGVLGLDFPLGVLENWDVFNSKALGALGLFTLLNPEGDVVQVGALGFLGVVGLDVDSRINERL